jgi:hypothetical protein
MSQPIGAGLPFRLPEEDLFLWLLTALGFDEIRGDSE